MDEKEAEARPVMGTIFLVTWMSYYYSCLPTINFTHILYCTWMSYYYSCLPTINFTHILYCYYLDVLCRIIGQEM